MLRRLLYTAAATTLLLTPMYAQQSAGNQVSIQVGRVDPTNGKQMYGSYCAPCHGQDGRGNGPVSGALKARPTDLTSLAKTHHGKYPDTHVVAVLEFGSTLPSHGSAEMPVWGPLLGNISNVHSQEAQLRITNLARYLESIQAK